MCEHGKTKDVWVHIPADLSHTGEGRWGKKPIDECIHRIVHALNNEGVLTRGACCGHGNGEGSIILQDGRELVVRPARPVVECAVHGASPCGDSHGPPIPTCGFCKKAMPEGLLYHGCELGSLL